MKIKIENMSIELSPDELNFSPALSSLVRQGLSQKLPALARTQPIPLLPPHKESAKPFDMKAWWAGQLQRWKETGLCVYCDRPACKGRKMCRSHRARMFHRR